MRAMRHLPATLLALSALLLPLVGHAEPTGFDSPPASLAARVLGDRPGTIVAGTWRDGTARYAIQRNRPGHVGKAKAMAPGEAQPVFEIGSISKVFTGLLLAQAVERGDFSLDDTLGRLLADKATLPPPVATITLRQLITHTACLPNLPALPARPPGPDSNPFARPTRAHLMVALSSLELAQSPPCAPRYGSLGIALVGQLLSDRYGQPWDQLVRERIAVPLGMKDTVQHLDAARAKRLPQGYAGHAARSPWEFGALAAAGALRSTAPDLLLFARALMAGRAGPLGAAAERLREPLSAQGEYDVGYALRMRDPAAGGAQRRIYFHTGQTGGYRALLAFSPATSEALVLLASNDAAAVVPVLDALTLPLAAK
ncbi:MAG: class A beta-lactamase-related serine hydrolase [Variovorax sp.]|jgi:CubicO group peptidase (beta-lactamase class C family)|nr:MAG: class A beta-lactamase-related serine hydrolase [Variovorax sp.]